MGRFPLGGGNDGERGGNDGGMKPGNDGERGGNDGGMGRGGWVLFTARYPRSGRGRLRGKRGYDGGGAGMTEGARV